METLDKLFFSQESLFSKMLGLFVYNYYINKKILEKSEANFSAGEKFVSLEKRKVYLKFPFVKQITT